LASKVVTVARLAVSRLLRQREFEGAWRAFPQATQAAKSCGG